MNIHPLAVVSQQAQIGKDVQIGPFAIVEDDVVIGDGCKLAAHVVIKNGVRMGPRNTICESTVIGGMPQHTNCPKDIGQVLIGEGNTLREYCTVHRAVKPETPTTLGDGCYLMAGTHVAHDCRLGSRIIMANNGLLGGHVSVGDRAFISGGVAVHQFCRIGQMAMVGGNTKIVRDVPPYVTVDGSPSEVVGLNIIGLKRNGFSQEHIAVLKAAYRVIYRSGLPWREMLQQLSAEFAAGPAAVMVDFMMSSARGYSQERRPPRSVTLKLRKDQDELETPGAVPMPAASPAMPAADSLRRIKKAG